MNFPHIIKGGKHIDNRGELRFVNDFRFHHIKRFYIIQMDERHPFRAWQGHRLETKYFYCLSGTFWIYLVKIDDWENPSSDLPVIKYKLNDNTSEFLVVPPGYVNGIQSLFTGAQLLVLSDKFLDQSLQDDFRFRMDYWNI